MPQLEVEEAVVPVAQDVLYQPGISFMNPRVGRPKLAVQGRPWFYSPQVPGPLTASSKLRSWKGQAGNFREYKAVWNRAAKNRSAQRLGAYFHDVPTIQELGAAPPATSETANTERGPLGFLENLITAGAQVASGVTDALARREEQKQQSLIAQIQARTPQIFQTADGGTNIWLIVAGVGVVGLGAYFLTRR